MRGTLPLAFIPCVEHLSLSLPSRPSRPEHCTPPETRCLCNASVSQFRRTPLPPSSLLPALLCPSSLSLSLHLPLSFRGENEPSSGEETGKGGDIALTSVCALGLCSVEPPNRREEAGGQHRECQPIRWFALTRSPIIILRPYVMTALSDEVNH